MNFILPQIFQYLLPLLPLAISIIFTALGICLVALLIFSKIVYFFVNIWNTYLPKKAAKLRIDIKTKSFLISLIGVCFIVALSFSANNWFIYALAIVIIATLVTELEFLEKVVALFWNREAYWKYRGQIDKNAQQPTVPTSEEERKELEEQASKKEGETQTDNNTPPWLLMYHSEVVYRLIFGSQIGILQWLTTNEHQGVPKSQIEAAYAKNPISATYPFENYIGFLINNQLVRLDASSTTLHITPVGKFFLDYLAKNQIPPVRPN